MLTKLGFSIIDLIRFFFIPSVLFLIKHKSEVFENVALSALANQIRTHSLSDRDKQNFSLVKKKEKKRHYVETFPRRSETKHFLD